MKKIYSIEKSSVTLTRKDLKKLYAGYSFEHDTDIETIGNFDSYELAMEEFSKLQPSLDYDCYNKKYSFNEYQLSCEVVDEDEDIVDFEILKSKDALFVAENEDGEVVEKSERMNDLIYDYGLNNIKVVAK